MKESTTKATVFFLVLILVTEPFGSRIYQASKIKPISEQTLEPAPPAANLASNSPAPRERRLRQRKSSLNRIEVEFRPSKNNSGTLKTTQPQNHFFVPKRLPKLQHRRLRKLKKKENLMELAKGIREEAKRHNLRIKRVYLGDRVRKSMGDVKLARDLSSLLSAKSIKSRMRKLKKNIKKAAKSRKNSKKNRVDDKANAESNAVKLGRSLMGSTSGGSSKGSSKDKENEMEFNFMPGFAGMPFPPFMMNGPHFHPPLNVTVNALPNPNQRAMEHPSALEETNIEENQEILEPILDKLTEIKGKLEGATSDTNVDIQGKFQQVLNGFF